MLQVQVYLAALGLLAATASSFLNEGQISVTSCPILFYGQLYNTVYVNVSQDTVAICFKGPPPATPDNDCVLFGSPKLNTVTSSTKSEPTKIGSYYHRQQPALVFESKCYAGVIFKDSGSDSVSIYFRQFVTQADMFVFLKVPGVSFAMVVGGAVVEIFTKTKNFYQGLTGCRPDGVFYAVKQIACRGEALAKTCTAEGVFSDTTPCIKPYTCTGIGSNVINVFNSVTFVPDRCAYTLLAQPGVRLLAVFRDRRRKDVRMLDRVILQLNGSGGVQVTLGPGGRLQVNDDAPLSLGSSPLSLPGANVTKSQSGVTATFLFSNRTASVFFDGFTAQIMFKERTSATFPGLCFSPSVSAGDKSPELSSSSCMSKFSEPTDTTIDCKTVDKRCSVLREAPFASCHNHTDPEPFITVCKTILCRYGAKDTISRCQFLEAYVKTCDVLTNGVLAGWRSQVGCASSPASCQDALCSDHEYCVPDSIGGFRCACRAIFASEYRPRGAFGEPTVCNGSSASVTLVGCLLEEKGIEYSELHLNNRSCRGQVDNETHMVTFGFDSSNACGTVATLNNSQVIYKNSIMTSNSSDIITRHDQFVIDFSCYYQQPDMKTVGFRIRDSSVMLQIVSGHWNYTLTMKAYSDAGRTQAIGPSQEIQLQQRVWVELKTDGLDDKLVSVVTDSCWATNQPLANSSLRYDLIVGGCSKPADLLVEANGLGTSNFFSFKMFHFSGKNNDVYLHCKVNLCAKKGNTCAPSCGGKRRRRSSRATSEDGSSAFITMAWTN